MNCQHQNRQNQNTALLLLASDRPDPRGVHPQMILIDLASGVHYLRDGEASVHLMHLRRMLETLQGPRSKEVGLLPLVGWR